MPKSMADLITDKARIAIASYPTQGITLPDLIDLTIEFCQDFDRNPAQRTVKSVIKRAGFLKIKGRYYPAVPPQRKAEETPAAEPAPTVVKNQHDKTDWRLRVYGGVRCVTE